jgi:SAM-dependent methyltransferase
VRRLKPILRAARNLVYRVVYRGTGRWCPVCAKPSRRFAPFGIERRDGAMCIYCAALERHRLLWLFFERRTDLFDGRAKRMLHIAPERSFAPRLRARLGAGYLTADRDDPGADVRMDITGIEYPDATFDVIYCSHVLEHVPDDRQALREFYRVLKPRGWAVILVPITVDKTIEDPSITDPKERLRLFGQDDHVRRYGRDFVGRLQEAGFDVQVFGASDIADRTEAGVMGLRHDDEIFHCTKLC